LGPAILTIYEECMGKRIFAEFALITLISILFLSNAHAVRIKDIAEIKGVRGNQLVGYGLVVGLDGTGDGKEQVTVKSRNSLFNPWQECLKKWEWQLILMILMSKMLLP